MLRRLSPPLRDGLLALEGFEEAQGRRLIIRGPELHPIGGAARSGFVERQRDALPGLRDLRAEVDFARHGYPVVLHDACLDRALTGFR